MQIKREMGDYEEAQQLAKFWEHAEGDFMEFHPSPKRIFHGSFRMELHEHDWYALVWVGPARSLHVRLYVLDPSVPLLSDRLVLITAVPVVDPLWLPHPRSTRLVSTEFCRLIKEAKRPDLSRTCHQVMVMMRRYLQQKLDTDSYRQELEELIRLAAW